MLRHHITSVLRNIKRNKGYTAINIAGLSIGITACIMIFLLITYELSFDKFNSRYNRIYRVVQDTKITSGVNHNPAMPYPFADAFRNDFDDVPLLTQFHYEGETLVNVNGNKQIVDQVIFADSLFFKVFDFKVLSGNPEVDLALPGKVFLTKSLADRILKNDTQVSIKLNNVTDVEVAGIIADPPATSHIMFSMIVSYPSLTSDYLGGLPLNEWQMSSSGYCYLVLPDNTDAASIEDRFKGFIAKYHSIAETTNKTYKLQPLHEIHFDVKYADEQLDTDTNLSDLWTLGILGVFIVVIACINFINLATALSVKRSKEVGVRKTLGARREHVIGYFFAETFFLTVFSLLISLCISEWLLTWLNPFLEKKITLNLFSDPVLMLFLTGLVIFVTLLSGFYPATVLSRFNPAAVLKNKIITRGASGAGLRKVLVVFQFLVAQALIIGTLVINDQVKFFKNKPLGFNKEAIITIEMPIRKKEVLEAFRSRIEANPDVVSLSFCVGAPTSDNNFNTRYTLSENGTEQYKVDMKLVDHHYLETYGIKLKAGRWFNENEDELTESLVPPEGQKYVYVINEAAMKQLGFYNPEQVIGKFITTGVMDIRAEVVGVVEDFHTKPLHEKIPPVILMNFPYFYYYAGIKIDSQNLSHTIGFIEKTWSALHPDSYFRYEFLDDKLGELYGKEERIFTLFKIFSAVSILIGCLGLYGLISFVTTQKTKEVGIRKVLGASVSNIIVLFSREFVLLVFIAFLLATPTVWYTMNKWLEGFSYHTDIHWSVFAIGMGSTLLIALTTVGYRSLLAAHSNPVDTLRSE